MGIECRRPGFEAQEVVDGGPASELAAELQPSRSWARLRFA
jgi:hypothetical protein